MQQETNINTPNINTKLLKLWRTFKEGATNFYRNGWLSFATVSVLVISLYIISVTAITGVTARMLLNNIQDKVNVTIYFNPTVTEERIKEVKSKLEGYKEIESVTYVSREEALKDFKTLIDNPTINEALDEIGENPLLSSVVIKAKDTNDYQLIVEAISTSSLKEDISRINYQENKTLISRLNRLRDILERVGMIMGIVFIVIAILITFNAIRLTMYAQKQEFEVKRLVGASNMYIRMPFIFEGIMYGAVASIVVMILLLLTVNFVSPITKGSIPQGDLMKFILSHSGLIFIELLAGGALLGMISGIIAIRRYLKI